MSARVLFVGNRRFVLEEILALGMPLAGIGVIAGTHLEHDIQKGALASAQLGGLCHRIEDKRQLLSFIRQTPFDILVSNGCPYILPVDELPEARYVNIHPSFLPDLRGYDPVIGAILYGRDAGATCHVMDRAVDAGEIIAQVRIPATSDLDVTTLYQLSFWAEKDVFRQAAALDFVPQYPQADMPDALTYRRSQEDMTIFFTESNDVILRKVKAYNNRSIGCRFRVGDSFYKVFRAEILHNSYARSVVMRSAEGKVALSYENSIVFHKDGQVLRFMDIVSPDGQCLNVGDVLFTRAF